MSASLETVSRLPRLVPRARLVSNACLGSASTDRVVTRPAMGSANPVPRVAPWARACRSRAILAERARRARARECAKALATAFGETPVPSRATMWDVARRLARPSAPCRRAPATAPGAVSSPRACLASRIPASRRRASATRCARTTRTARAVTRAVMGSVSPPKLPAVTIGRNREPMEAWSRACRTAARVGSACSDAAMLPNVRQGSRVSTKAVPNLLPEPPNPATTAVAAALFPGLGGREGWALYSPSCTSPCVFDGQVGHVQIRMTTLDAGRGPFCLGQRDINDFLDPPRRPLGAPNGVRGESSRHTPPTDCKELEATCRLRVHPVT